MDFLERYFARRQWEAGLDYLVSPKPQFLHFIKLLLALLRIHPSQQVFPGNHPTWAAHERGRRLPTPSPASTPSSGNEHSSPRPHAVPIKAPVPAWPHSRDTGWRSHCGSPLLQNSPWMRVPATFASSYAAITPQPEAGKSGEGRASPSPLGLTGGPCQGCVVSRFPGGRL